MKSIDSSRLCGEREVLHTVWEWGASGCEREGVVGMRRYIIVCEHVSVKIFA